MGDPARTATLLSALALGGCLVESHETSDPLPIARFCDALEAALCEPLEECGCSDAAVTACHAEAAAPCRGFPSAALIAAIDDGRVVYDGSRAAALIRRTRERGETCEAFIPSLGWKVGDLLTLGGVFEGRLAPGEACESLGFELVTACRGGTCAPSDGGARCVAAVGPGETCDALHYCADLEGELTPARGIERFTLRCVRADPRDEAGTCAPWIEVGEACDRDGACWTGVCQDDRCDDLDVGATCLSSRECASGHCDTVRVCTPGDAAVAEPCDGDAACESHVCVAGRCEPAGCGVF